jgi:SAM-dependent methyltransferase
MHPACWSRTYSLLSLLSPLHLATSLSPACISSSDALLSRGHPLKARGPVSHSKYDMASAGGVQSSSAWSGNAQLYASSLRSIPGSISVAGAKLLQLETPVQGLPITFVDVAAGPGTLAMEVLEQMNTAKVGGRVIITDFASGMVEAAQARAEDARKAGTIPPSIEVQCTVMDGQALTLADACATHCGCMFGIMFYADVAKGVRELRRVLVKGGRCVVGTWRDAGAAHITDDFAGFLGLPCSKDTVCHGDGDSDAVVAQLQKVLDIGKDPAALEADLLAAGFSKVEIHAVPTTYRSPDWAPFLAMMRSNPAMSQYLARAPPDTDWGAQWKAFLTSRPGAAKYVPNGADLEVQWLANVAVATA